MPDARMKHNDDVPLNQFAVIDRQEQQYSEPAHRALVDELLHREAEHGEDAELQEHQSENAAVPTVSLLWDVWNDDESPLPNRRLLEQPRAQEYLQ